MGDSSAHCSQVFALRRAKRPGFHALLAAYLRGKPLGPPVRGCYSHGSLATVQGGGNHHVSQFRPVWLVRVEQHGGKYGRELAHAWRGVCIGRVWVKAQG